MQKGAVSTMRRGFTIVELLIIIVVVAILATITIIAYNGIQQRSTNVAVLAAAKQSQEIIQSYTGLNNNYPVISDGTTYRAVCITKVSGCSFNDGYTSADPVFDESLSSISNLPDNIPNVSATHYGIVYQYHNQRTVDGKSQPVILIYYLAGTNQDCGLHDILTYAPGYASPSPIMVRSTTGYTVGDVNGNTACFVQIEGKEHS